MYLEIAVLSEAGGRKINEDTCGYWSTTTSCCCTLSDGLGGYYGGEVASKLVLKHVLDQFRITPECSVQAIESLLRIGDAEIIQAQRADNKLEHMRATAVILTIDTVHNLAFWAHVGDSRLYCFRQGRIVIQTRDHSVSQNMIDAGYLKPEELRSSPNRSQLYAALGSSERFEADIVSAAYPVQYGDVFLLCSDGLWEYVEEKEMEQMLAASKSANEWLKALEEQVLVRGHKTQDNYSAIAVWCCDLDEVTQIFEVK